MPHTYLCRLLSACLAVVPSPSHGRILVCLQTLRAPLSPLRAGLVVGTAPLHTRVHHICSNPQTLPLACRPTTCNCGRIGGWSRIGALSAPGRGWRGACQNFVLLRNHGVRFRGAATDGRFLKSAACILLVDQTRVFHRSLPITVPVRGHDTLPRFDHRSALGTI